MSLFGFLGPSWKDFNALAARVATLEKSGASVSAALFQANGRIAVLEVSMSEADTALQEISDVKTKLTQVGNDLVLISAGIGQLNQKISDLQALASQAGSTINPDVQAALADLQTTAATLASQADAAALPFAPPR